MVANHPTVREVSALSVGEGGGVVVDGGDPGPVAGGLGWECLSVVEGVQVVEEDPPGDGIDDQVVCCEEEVGTSLWADVVQVAGTPEGVIALGEDPKAVLPAGECAVYLVLVESLGVEHPQLGCLDVGPVALSVGVLAVRRS